MLQVLETGHDILFFWVARMVMMGIGLTGQVRLGGTACCVLFAVHRLQQQPLNLQQFHDLRCCLRP
jgi:hypothetical protein